VNLALKPIMCDVLLSNYAFRAPRTDRLKLRCDVLLSTYAFKFKLRHCTKGAEAGLPECMHNLALYFHEGWGMAAPDHPAAAEWYRRAANAGDGAAAMSLCRLYMAGRGWARQQSDKISHIDMEDDHNDTVMTISIYRIPYR